MTAFGPVFLLWDMTGWYPGVPQVREDQIEDNTAFIILMGVNDLYHVNDYISYINSKAAEWGNRGAQTYFALSVGPGAE